MNRRMSLGCALVLLLLVLMVGAVPASAEPQKASQAVTVESRGLLSRAWEWLTALVVDTKVDTSTPGDGAQYMVDGGVFIDPLGGTN